MGSRLPSAFGTGELMPFLDGMQVYDKAGRWLGSILNGRETQAPSRGVNFEGSCSITVPRKIVDPATGDVVDNPDLDTDVIPDHIATFGDRLIVIGDSMQAADPWLGIVNDVEWTDGGCLMNCTDFNDWLSTPQLPEDDDMRGTQALKIPTGTAATLIAQMLIGVANVWYGRNGEVEVKLDATGSKTFFGDETATGDVKSAFATLVERAFVEMAWRVELTATTMTPVLVLRDSFVGAEGAPLKDGLLGNIVAGPSVSVSPPEVVNAVRITGSVTVISPELPEGATALPVQQTIPLAEAWWPDDGYRRRLNSGLGAGVIQYIDVPFTFAADEEAALKAAEDARLRALFSDFVHAFHAQFGMPWHGDSSGGAWSWEGSYTTESGGDSIDNERDLTVDRYTHWGELGVGPVHVVMRETGGLAGTYPRWTNTIADWMNCRTGPSRSNAVARTITKGTRVTGVKVTGGSYLAPTTTSYVPKAGCRTWNTWIKIYSINGVALSRVLYAAAYYFAGPVGTVTSNSGGLIRVAYDRVNDVRTVARVGSVASLPDETVLDFEWRAFNQGAYSPERNGVGRLSPYRTVKAGVVVDQSWRVMPYGDEGTSGQTTIVHGIDATQTECTVVSMFSLPDDLPYVVTIDSDEKVLVTSTELNLLTIQRGYDGTVASIHEKGAPLEYTAPQTPEDQAAVQTDPLPIFVAWPEGEAYAAALLTKLHHPKRKFTNHLANVGGDAATIALGSTHDYDVDTEGPPGGVHTRVRVIGFAPDWGGDAPAMELFLEEL
jgi:hypothetical protein